MTKRPLVNTLVIVGIVVLGSAHLLTPGFVINLYNNAAGELTVTLHNSSLLRDKSPFSDEQRRLIEQGMVGSFRRFRVCFRVGCRIGDYSVGITIANDDDEWQYPDVIIPSGSSHRNIGLLFHEIRLVVDNAGIVYLLPPYRPPLVTNVPDQPKGFPLEPMRSEEL